MNNLPQKHVASILALFLSLFLLFVQPLRVQGQGSNQNNGQTDKKKKGKKDKDQDLKKMIKPEMHLTFSSEGKLLGGYLPRYNPNLCKTDNCKNDYSLSVRVLLPVDFYDEEKKEMEKRATEADSMINKDTKSTLYRIIKCPGTYKGYDTVLKKIITGADISKWNDSIAKSIMPDEFFRYYKFLSAFKSKNYESLNTLKEFSPFRLRLKGILLDTSCFRFLSYDNVSDSCHCVPQDKQFILLEFGIPPGLITKEITVDSFQLTRTFKMKEVALAWYNDNMLVKQKKSIVPLQILQKRIKQKEEVLKSILNSIDSLQSIQIFCNDSTKMDSLRKIINANVCNYKKILEDEFGSFDCNEYCKNTLLCSEVLQEWVVKLIWLNGGWIKLNPFDFTSASNFAPKQSSEKANAEALKIEQRKALTQQQFWDVAIKHLEDSVMLVKGMNLDTIKFLLDNLLDLREKAVASLSKKVPVAAADESASNAEKMNNFITVSQVNYKGWLIPYKINNNSRFAYKPDKMWMRSYYLDQMPNPLRQKLHFTYPEDENVTLLLHNMPAGTYMAVGQSKQVFADSAPFTIFAGEFVSQAAALYTSLGKVAPIIQKALRSLQNSTQKDRNTASQLLVNNTLSDALLSFGVSDKQATIMQVQGSLENNKLITKKDKEVLKNKPPLDFVLKSELGQTMDSARLYTYSRSAIQDLIEKFLRGRKISDITKKTIDSCNNTLDTCYINYIKSLYAIVSTPALIDKKLEEKNNNIPLYYSGKEQLKDHEAPYMKPYSLSTYTKEGDKVIPGVIVDSSYIKVGKFRYFQTAAGIAYTPNAGFITSIDTTGGGFKIDRDEDRFRLIAGLRWYPLGLYNQKNPVGIWNEWRWLHRLSVLVATSVPKPLRNMYVGGGFDVVPGLNLSAGGHFQQQNRYTILNNQVKDRSVVYRGRAFYSVTVDPNLLINAITSLVK